VPDHFAERRDLCADNGSAAGLRFSEHQPEAFLARREEEHVRNSEQIADVVVGREPMESNVFGQSDFGSEGVDGCLVRFATVLDCSDDVALYIESSIAKHLDDTHKQVLSFVRRDRSSGYELECGPTAL
jgi:hypothetical protein